MRLKRESVDVETNVVLQMILARLSLPGRDMNDHPYKRYPDTFIDWISLPRFLAPSAAEESQIC